MRQAQDSMSRNYNLRAEIGAEIGAKLEKIKLRAENTDAHEQGTDDLRDSLGAIKGFVREAQALCKEIEALG